MVTNSAACLKEQALTTFTLQTTAQQTAYNLSGNVPGLCGQPSDMLLSTNSLKPSKKKHIIAIHAHRTAFQQTISSHAADSQHVHAQSPALVQAKVPLDLLAAQEARAAQAQQVDIQALCHQAVLDAVLASTPGESKCIISTWPCQKHHVLLFSMITTSKLS